MEKQTIVKGKTFKQVRKLNLSGRDLAEIPSYVFQYTNLTKLVLSRNAIKKIPKEIAKLKKLEVLDLTYNELDVLPAPLFKLPKLRVLAVGHNQIKKFPSQLVGSSVKQLIADHNQIEKIDTDALNGLEKLVISNNPISGQLFTRKVPGLKYYDFRHTNLDYPPEGALSEDCKWWRPVRPAVITDEMIARKMILDAFVKDKMKETEEGSIFISHSSKDRDLVMKFHDEILLLGIGIPAERIYCTSIEGRGIENGEKMREWIHDHITGCDLAFLMISPNYKKSEICLNEMGAIWALNKTEKIILLPGVDFDNFGWLEAVRQAGHIDQESVLDELFDFLSSRYNLKKKAVDWGRHKKNFLEYCKSLPPSQPTVLESSEIDKTKRIYLQYCNKVFDMLWYNHFSGWTEMLTGGTIPKIPTKMLDNLEALSSYLDSRAKYAGYEQFDKLFITLSMLIADFISVFGLYAKEKGDFCCTRTFYRDNPKNPNYDEDLADYTAYVDFIRNITFELTRICNALLFEARRLMVDYKQDFGIFHIDGIHHNGDEIARFEYAPGECYVGLNDFINTAMTRKYHIKFSIDRVMKILDV